MLKRGFILLSLLVSTSMASAQGVIADLDRGILTLRYLLAGGLYRREVPIEHYAAQDALKALNEIRPIITSTPTSELIEFLARTGLASESRHYFSTYFFDVFRDKSEDISKAELPGVSLTKDVSFRHLIKKFQIIRFMAAV